MRILNCRELLATALRCRMDNVNLRLKIYSYIDENRNEIIIVPAEKMDTIKNEFDKIRKIYSGEYKDIINDQL